MGTVKLIAFSVAVLVVLFGFFALLTRLRMRRGRADGVRQLVGLDDDRLLSLDYLYFSGGDGDPYYRGRLSLRALSDGRVLTRVDADDNLRIVARAGAQLVGVGARPRVCVIDASTLTLVADETAIQSVNPELEALAPASALAPQLEDGRLSVLTAQGRRLVLKLPAVGSLEAVPTERPRFDQRIEGSETVLVLEGHPRTQLLRWRTPVEGVDFLGGYFLIDPPTKERVLVFHEVTLHGGDGAISALDAEQRVCWTTRLGRKLQSEVNAAVVTGQKLVLSLHSDDPHPAELICLDLRSGALLWRQRP